MRRIRKQRRIGREIGQARMQSRKSSDDVDVWISLRRHPCEDEIERRLELIARQTKRSGGGVDMLNVEAARRWEGKRADSEQRGRVYVEFQVRRRASPRETAGECPGRDEFHAVESNPGASSDRDVDRRRHTET